MIHLNLFVFISLAGLLIQSVNTTQSTNNLLTFPSNFLFGVSTSAYQVEGAYNADGKGENVWDKFVQQKSVIHDGSTGNVACNSYYKYKEDVKLVSDIGFNAYRFSVSWSRILPTGFSNHVNRKGIDYYNKLIDEALSRNITPVLTLYHFDLPQTLEDLGGWTNEALVDWFGEYARIIFSEFGDRVKYFITVNEPGILCTMSYSQGIFAPGKQIYGIGEYMCSHNLLKAHARAYHIYKTEFKKKYNGLIGFAENLKHFYNKYENDTESAEIAHQFYNGWTVNPIFSKDGDYPELMKKIIKEQSEVEGYNRSRLPEFTPEWINYIRGSADFLGVNHYTTYAVEPGRIFIEPPSSSGPGIRWGSKKSWKQAASFWINIVPEGFGDLLRRLSKDFDHPLMFVTENGVSDYGELEDDVRIEYHHNYMKEMLVAINRDKLNIMGYISWSLMDNFEWAAGYSEKFGIVRVDFKDPNRRRTMKKSAIWWNQILTQKEIKLNDTLLKVPDHLLKTLRSDSSSANYVSVLIVSFILAVPLFFF